VHARNACFFKPDNCWSAFHLGVVGTLGLRVGFSRVTRSSPKKKYLPPQMKCAHRGLILAKMLLGYHFGPALCNFHHALRFAPVIPTNLTEFKSLRVSWTHGGRSLHPSRPLVILLRTSDYTQNNRTNERTNKQKSRVCEAQ
jgi:hypothetical protein